MVQTIFYVRLHWYLFLWWKFNSRISSSSSSSSSSLLLGVVAIEKWAFGSPSTTVANFYYYYYYFLILECISRLTYLLYTDIISWQLNSEGKEQSKSFSRTDFQTTISNYHSPPPTSLYSTFSASLLSTFLLWENTFYVVFQKHDNIYIYICISSRGITLRK